MAVTRKKRSLTKPRTRHEHTKTLRYIIKHIIKYSIIVELMYSISTPS